MNTNNQTEQNDAVSAFSKEANNLYLRLVMLRALAPTLEEKVYTMLKYAQEALMVLPPDAPIHTSGQDLIQTALVNAMVAFGEGDLSAVSLEAHLVHNIPSLWHGGDDTRTREARYFLRTSWPSYLGEAAAQYAEAHRPNVEKLRALVGEDPARDECQS